MNEKYLIGEEGVKSYEQNGDISGYEFGVRVPYYMGVPLSQINQFEVYMDGVRENPDNIRLIMKTAEEFKLAEIITVSGYHWEYGEKLRTVVLRDHKLPKGKHKLEVVVGIDVIYMPKGIGGSKAYLEFEI